MKNEYIQKILILITKSNFGGAQKYVYEIATSLPKDQFEVVVALGGNGKLKDKLEESGIKTIKIESLERDISLLKEFKVLAEIFKIYRKEKPDVIHLNSSKISGIGSLIGRLLFIKKIVFTAHGWAFNENRNWLSKIIIKFIYWLTIAFSHTTIAVSEQTKNQISKWPFISSKIKVINNGVKDIEFLERGLARQKINEMVSEKNSLENVLTLDPNKKWIVCFAELHKIKGLDVLIKSIPLIKSDLRDQFEIIIAGEGGERKNLEELVRRLKLQQVHLIGYLENAPLYLKGFDLYIQPSRSEALSLAVLEAGLAKLPVICTDVGGMSNVIINKETGLLIQKENKREIADAISYFIQNKNKAQNMAENLKQKVSTEFSFDKMLRETLNILTK